MADWTGGEEGFGYIHCEAFIQDGIGWGLFNRFCYLSFRRQKRRKNTVLDHRHGGSWGRQRRRERRKKITKCKGLATVAKESNGSSLDEIPKHLESQLNAMGIDNITISHLQKAALLGTARNI